MKVSGQLTMEIDVHTENTELCGMACPFKMWDFCYLFNIAIKKSELTQEDNSGTHESHFMFRCDKCQQIFKT